MTGPVFRVATAREVELMVDWAAAEGWNPGLDDAATFRASDPEGFFVAESGDRVVAAISVVNHSDDNAFLGFYICHPDSRGQGIGFALWQHALANAGTRTVGLDGVADQEANYARSGFVKTGATVRFEGVLPPSAHPRVRVAGDGDAEAIARLDLDAVGHARPGFLRAWTAPGKSRVTVVLDGHEGPEGYATIRRCRAGVKIGPIVGKDSVAALALAQAALARMPSDRVVIDVPSQRGELAEALQHLGFEETFATARMYRGPAPAGSGRLQAIATMELG